MSLAEETTQEIYDDDAEVNQQLIEHEIKMIAQDLDGKQPGCIEEELVLVGIYDVLSRHHEWPDSYIKEYYDISIKHDSSDDHWDVLVAPADA